MKCHAIIPRYKAGPYDGGHATCDFPVARFFRINHIIGCPEYLAYCNICGQNVLNHHLAKSLDEEISFHDYIVGSVMNS